MVKGKILYIEDNPDNFRLVQALLERDGYEVIGAEDGLTGLELANKQSPDLVLMDMNIPGLSGEECATRMKSIKGMERIPIVALTAKTMRGDKEMALTAGCDGFIAKPVDPFMFTSQVEEFLQGKVEKVEQTEETIYLREYSQKLVNHLEKQVQELTRFNQQLKESEEKYKVLVEQSNEGICLIQDSKILFSNPKLKQIFKYDDEDIYGDNFDFSQLIAPESLLFYQKQCLLMRQKENFPINCEVIALTKTGGKIDIEASLSYIEYKGKSAIQVIVRDITARKKMEKKQHELEIELLHQSKLASIGMLTSGIAHNLCNPLTVIRGSAELVLRKIPNLREAENIIAQANKMNDIIKNMMYKGRQEQNIKKQPIDISYLLTQELQFLEADQNFKHKIEKIFILDESLPKIEGIYSDFSQGLLNIIKNALDSMYHSPKKQLKVRTFAQENYICIEIGDTGCGIETENLDKIFSPFFTTKPIAANDDTPTGTGLGLSSAYNLLQPYQAKFEIVSKKQEGTTFIIRIPYK